MDTLAGSAILGFESEAERTLDCIPMRVRMKLDLCGLKLSLAQWCGLPIAVRRILLEEPCDTARDVRRAREYLVRAVEAHGLDALPVVHVDRAAWSAGSDVPSCVVSAMAASNLGHMGAPTWRRLDDLQRFALMKLSRPGHTRNLPAALEEFGLR
jgi:hypothetical protein